MLHAFTPSSPVKWNFSFIPWTFKSVRWRSKASRTATARCVSSGPSQALKLIPSWSCFSTTSVGRWCWKSPTVICQKKLETFQDWPSRFASRDKSVSRKWLNFLFTASKTSLDLINIFLGHHLIQTFAPSSLVVMLSWFSFWLGLDAIPGRVTLLVTCMLTLVSFQLEFAPFIIKYMQTFVEIGDNVHWRWHSTGRVCEGKYEISHEQYLSLLMSSWAKINEQ